MPEAGIKNEIRFAALKGLWSLLPGHRKYEAIRLCLMLMAGMALEMVGVGLILPVIALLTKPDLIFQHAIVQKMSEYVDLPSQQNLVLIIMVMLVVVYLVKNLYLGFLVWVQSRFIYGMQSEMAQKLFAIYLKQPYTFHLQHNTAHLIRNVQSEIGMFINGFTIPTLLILAEGMVVVGLFSLLMFVEPLGTLAVFGLICTAGGVFYLFVRHRLLNWGQQRQFHEGARIKLLQEGFGGVKDVKLLSREADFLRQYAMHTQQSMKMGQRQYAMLQVPRLWLELLAVTGLAVLMSTMTLQGKPLEGFIPVLALFAAISFRLMPSANRMISAVQQLRFGIPVIKLLSKEFKLEQQAVQSVPVKTEAFNNQIELLDVSYQYPNTEKLALSHVTLTIRKGETIGFVGESGSGKSTLIDLMLGLLTPVSGAIRMDKHDITQDPRPWQCQVGYVPQTIYLSDDTLSRNVAFGIAEQDIDDAAVIRAIKAAQLESFVAGLPEGLDTIVGERGVRLSGGQRQRIGIARALYHDPSVLVLDEATSALDNRTEAEVMEAINALQGKKTILIVAHRLTTVKGCDRIYKLDHGKITDADDTFHSRHAG